jgi:hypothetical protein
MDYAINFSICWDKTCLKLLRCETLLTSTIKKEHLVDYHAYDVVDMEAPECDGIRQRTTFGDVPIQRH